MPNIHNSTSSQPETSIETTNETNSGKSAFPSISAPLNMGNIQLDNRVFMAPLTRSRSTPGDNLQTPLHALYYAQRASAGLIISEATQISPQGQGYAWTPGIFTDEQVSHWKVVTEAVHNAGGRIFCQLWHVGAISHQVFQPHNARPFSSSEFQPEGEAFVGDLLPDGPTVPHPKAQAMTLEDIDNLKRDYRHAAKCAKEAGFDGIELHAANGYLLDQFIRSSVNKREDQYGGSVENRLRLLEEVIDVIAQEIPRNNIGVRLPPPGGPGGSYANDPEGTMSPQLKRYQAKALFIYMWFARTTTQAMAQVSSRAINCLRICVQPLAGCLSQTVNLAHKKLIRGLKTMTLMQWHLDAHF